jgi:thiol-disulfide isomerase/thioredoxin
MGQDASKNNLQANRKFSREKVQDQNNYRDVTNRNYDVINHANDVTKNQDFSKISEMSDGVIFILAEWCGHCITLKSSREIKNLKNKMPVLELDDKHPETKGLMDQVDSRGYPTIVVVKNNKLNKYTGARTASSIFDFYNKL